MFSFCNLNLINSKKKIINQAPSCKKQQGFTIVELLIVIVIIGILAALIIASYTGIQQRASNTSRIASVQQYIKMLSLYATQNGKYPYFSNGACLGSGYTNGECTNADLTQTYPVSATEQATFNSQLSTVGRIPDFPKLNSAANGSGNEVGAFIYNRGTTDETPSRSNRLVYFLQGNNVECGIPRVLRAVNGTSVAGTGAWGTGLSTVKPNNSNYNNGRTFCIISLLNPDEF